MYKEPKKPSKMKLIKLKNDHYVMVDDSEIREGDYSFYPPFGIGKNIIIDGELCFYIEPKDGKGSFTQRTYQILDRNKKITHSTQPLEQYYGATDGTITFVYHKIIELTLLEVKELIGEVDVEQIAVDFAADRKLGAGHGYPSFEANLLERGFLSGYNQSLEDNKEKKYTEEDMKVAITQAFLCGLDRLEDFGGVQKMILENIQPKTEWEVELIDGKLKLEI